MKKLEEPLIRELTTGGCVPAVTKLAKKLRQPGSTVHFNIKKMEKEGKILGYKAVFDNEKVGRGFTVFALLKLDPTTYKNPKFAEEMATQVAKHPAVESVDIMTGDWELLVKVHAKDQKEYYETVSKGIAREGVVKIHSMVSLKELKSEYFRIP